MTSTLLEPIEAELGRRAALTSFPYDAYDAFRRDIPRPQSCLAQRTW